MSPTTRCAGPDSTAARHEAAGAERATGPASPSRAWRRRATTRVCALICVNVPRLSLSREQEGIRATCAPPHSPCAASRGTSVGAELHTPTAVRWAPSQSPRLPRIPLERGERSRLRPCVIACRRALGGELMVDFVHAALGDQLSQDAVGLKLLVMANVARAVA